VLVAMVGQPVWDECVDAFALRTLTMVQRLVREHAGGLVEGAAGLAAGGRSRLSSLRCSFARSARGVPSSPR
jgi:hypothetical protein